MSDNIITGAAIVGKKFLKVDSQETLKDENARGRDRAWSYKKTKSLKMYELIERASLLNYSREGIDLIKPERLITIEECGNTLIFGVFEDPKTKKHKKKLVFANFCRHRLCPMCNWRKSIRLFGIVSKITSAILAKEKRKFLFLTLTIRNVSAGELQKALDSMNEGFKWLVQKSKTYKPAKKLKESLCGYIKAVEITYNPKDDTYHPHIHAILDVSESYFQRGNYITQEEFSEMWAGAIHADYVPVVDIRKVKAEEDEKPSPGAVAEVAKYPVKFESVLDIPDKDTAANAVITLCNVLQNRRMVTMGGEFREIAHELKLETDVEQSNLIHVEIDNEEGLNLIGYAWYKFNAKQGVYIMDSVSDGSDKSEIQIHTIRKAKIKGKS